MKTLTKLTALIVGLITAAFLVVQVAGSTEALGSLGAALFNMSGYFTVLTNLMVAVVLIGLGLGRMRARPALLGGITLWILIVGAVYHLLLAGLSNPQGLNAVADFGLHTVVPLLVALWWVVFAPKTGMNRRTAAHWLAWPLIYVVYAVVRAQWTGTYPYPFINLDSLGPVQFGINVLGLAAAFYGAGLGLVWLAKRLR